MNNIYKYNEQQYSEGIAAVKKTYDNYPGKSIAIKAITTFLALILKLNNFLFNRKSSIFKLKDVRWAQYTLQLMLMHLRQDLNQSFQISLSLKG